MAEARAEVLEELIKNPTGSTPSSPARSRSMDSLEERSDSGDELSTFEKGVQKKFNSVSSSIQSVSSGGESGESQTGKTPNISSQSVTPIQARQVVQSKPLEELSQSGDSKSSEPIKDKEIEVISENIVKVTKKDGTLRGTVFGPSPTKNAGKPSAMQIARQISQSDSSLKPPIPNSNLRSKSDSAAPLMSAILPSKPMINRRPRIDLRFSALNIESFIFKPELQYKVSTITFSISFLNLKSLTPSVQSEPTSSVTPPSQTSSASKSANSSRRASATAETIKSSLKTDTTTERKTGTWFGSKRQARPPVELNVAEKFKEEKKKEDDAMALLDAATAEASPSTNHKSTSENSTDQSKALEKSTIQNSEKPSTKTDNGSVSRRGATRESYRNAFDKPPEKSTAVKTVPAKDVKTVPLKDESSYERKPKAKTTELTAEEVCFDFQEKFLTFTTIMP